MTQHREIGLYLERAGRALRQAKDNLKVLDFEQEGYQ